MRTPATDGLLLVDKPPDVTSHDVVAVARRALGARRAGHAGTLDPFATGLLVLFLGRATRVLPYIDGEPKEYEATVRFGAETDTDDITGTVIRTAELPTREDVERGMRALTGEIDQLPPAYSAKKVGGLRAYDAARRGKPLALALVPVRVDEWTIREWRENEVDVSVTCGSGTYMRALARDLGRLAGSAAHLSALRRLRSGAFTVADACSMDELRAGRYTIRPILDAVRSLPVEQLDDMGLVRAERGQEVPATVGGRRAVLLGPDGELIAIAERQGNHWQPRVVLKDG